MVETIRVPVEVAEPLTGGEPALRVPVEVAEPITGGEPDLRAPVEVAEPLTGGNPLLRACVSVLEVLCAAPPEGWMATLVFPKLIGLSFSVMKKPVFASRVSIEQSGHEVRTANYPFPRWEFELSYDYLPDRAAGASGYSDLRTLVGFFLKCQGSFANFLFRDDATSPPDYHVAGGVIADPADGATAQYPLVRDMGGFLEPIGQIDLSALFTFAPGSVNTGTNKITLPAHGLTTAQTPPMTIASTGAIPSGLAVATPYWPIVVDANTIQLASSPLKASLGTALSLGSTGSGAMTLSKGYGVYYGVAETHSVPGTGPYTIVPTHGATITADGGVTLAGSPLVAVPGAPAAGQYKVDLATGTYTFNAAQASASVVISYTYLEDPTNLSILMPNQLVFGVGPAAATVVTADFDFYFVCRWLDDAQQYENFMFKLWQLSKAQFVAVPA